jgi:hypothetical protein
MGHCPHSLSPSAETNININDNSNSHNTNVIPDLIITKCPVDDCSHCAIVYVNKLIGHRIICGCLCHSLAEDKREKERKLQGTLLVGSQKRQAVSKADGSFLSYPSRQIHNVEVSEKIPGGRSV